MAASVLALMSAPLTVLTASPAQAAPETITVVGTNDFHGRLLRDPANTAQPSTIPGAAKYAGAVEQLRGENPNLIFAAAGDLIGATTFESFINQDKPTIDVLNAMDLDVSAVGNHELDKGWDDLTQRVMQPESPSNEFGGAEWEYIAANLTGPEGEEDLIEDSWVTDVAGVQIGFVGAVTEDLPSLVSPDGIEGVEVSDIVDATNAEADRLVAEEGADVVVMLVHEGAPGTDCSTMSDPQTTWGNIVTGVNDNVDAIISGHTHLAYNCTLEGRPVVSAGQYGSFLNKLDFTVESTTGEVTAVEQEILNVNTGTYPNDPEVEGIVAEAVADAEGPGSVALGEIAGPFNRAQRPTSADPNVSEENRGAESTLGNKVAEVQRWATGTDIAFMNPGGLRADMRGNNTGGYPAELSYRQAADVQPFANTLVTMDMTGAQIKTVLEQQWQTNPGGPTPSRPFLRLGASDGFEQQYDPARPEGDRITGMSLDGEPIAAGQTYRVTVNSFLASGGDNFRAFGQATDKRDSGQVDLEAMVDYMAEFASGEPLAPDFDQRAVGVHFPDGSRVSKGGELRVELSSLAMTGAGDLQDENVTVELGGQPIATVPVDNSVAPGQTFDESGTAEIEVTIPRGTPAGVQALTVVGDNTGTDFEVPIRVTKIASTTAGSVRPTPVVAKQTRNRVVVNVGGEIGTPNGRVVLRVTDKPKRVARLSDGRAVFRIGKFARAGLKAANVRYLGNGNYRASADSFTFRARRK